MRHHCEWQTSNIIQMIKMRCLTLLSSARQFLQIIGWLAVWSDVMPTHKRTEKEHTTNNNDHKMYAKISTSIQNIFSFRRFDSLPCQTNALILCLFAWPFQMTWILFNINGVTIWISIKFMLIRNLVMSVLLNLHSVRSVLTLAGGMYAKINKKSILSM